MTEPDRAPPTPATGFPAAIIAKRAGLTPGQRSVYQAVLRAFAATGQPPAPGEMADAARPFGLSAGQALAGLAAADVLGLDDDHRIRVAYPFSAAPTDHVVSIEGGPRVHAMCAIDALGIPPMLGADAVISSADPLTGAPVTVTFRGGHASWHPVEAVVFVGRLDCDGSSEQVRCGYLNFFSAPASAARWASQHPRVVGGVLGRARAEAFGAEIFGGLLNPGT